jgi:hypothetical protein
LAFDFALRPRFIHAFLHLFDALLHFGLLFLLLLNHLLATFLLLTQELLPGQAATAGIVGKTARHARWIRSRPTFHALVRTELGRRRRRIARKRAGWRRWNRGWHCRALCARCGCRLSCILILFRLHNRCQQHTASDGTRHQQLQPACICLLYF